MSASAQSMFDFFILLLKEIPDFLLAEPVCYIFGCCVGIFVVGLFSKLLKVAQ